jgi:CobQ-like glutamine amidotransferase family enzyme
MTGLVIATLFPGSTVAAGDEANMTALARRARARGLEPRTVVVNLPQQMVDADVYLLGGTGRTGTAALVDQLHRAGLTARLRSSGAVVFAVDAGMDALARSFTDTDGSARDGLGLLGITTTPVRPITHTVVSGPVASLGLPAMVGWISTDVHTVRDAQTPPLSEIEAGAPATHRFDGAITDQVVATRLHGPVLALNPQLADLILARAVGEDALGWARIPDPATERARDQRIAEVRATRHRPGTLRRLSWGTRTRT